MINFICKSFNVDETEGKIEKLQHPNDNNNSSL
jgi:hypothetical protein